VRKVHGVTDALVTLGPARAKVWSDGPVSETALVKAVESAGAYTVTDITSEALVPAVEHHGAHETGNASVNASGQASGNASGHAGGHTPGHSFAHARAQHHSHAHHDPLPAAEYVSDAAHDARPLIVRLYPLLLIVGFITLVAALATSFRAGGNPFAEGPSWSWHAFMLDFMAGFFLVFSFFKLLDIRGFASAYAMYDLLAMRVGPWAFAYPFVELALGIMYLVRFQLPIANIATLALMLFGAIGILNALRQKKQLRCACLGTALNLPMTTVTLVEDLVMAAMAGAMLAWPVSA
jgi:hypothetical protein